MSKGCKIWLWFLLIVNVFTTISLVFMLFEGNFILFGGNVYVADIIASMVGEILLIAGVYLMLFKQNKLGFYLFLLSSVICFFYELAVLGVPATKAVLRAVVSPTITYLFLRKGA